MFINLIYNKNIVYLDARIPRTPIFKAVRANYLQLDRILLFIGGFVLHNFICQLKCDVIW